MNMTKIVVFGLLALMCVTLVVAQSDETESDGPNYDELTTYLNLTETQVSCLETNRSSFRDAVATDVEQLRDLQRQLRQAIRNGEDTTSIQSEIDALQASIQSVRTTFIASAAGCLDGNQQAQISELVQAETLLNEVRQGIGLLLLQSTEERTHGSWGGFGPRRGRGR